MTAESNSGFRVTETMGETGLRSQLIDGNSAEVDALTTKEFWAAIIGKSAIQAFVAPLSMDLQEFFGTKDSPNELIVVSPLRDTRAKTPIREMYASCMESHFAMHQNASLFLPARFHEETDYDALISVQQGDWVSVVPHHDNVAQTGFTVFSAVQAKLPKDFLFPWSNNLSQVQWDIMRAGLGSIDPNHN